jgi:hypothetical protein
MLIKLPDHRHIIHRRDEFLSERGLEMGFQDYSNRILSRFMTANAWKKHYYHIKYRHIGWSGLGGLLKMNVCYKDIHRGQRCFILGNGPSLSKVDLSLLKEEITFTVNDLFYHEDFEKINTTYHLFADPFYFSRVEDLMKKLTEKASPSRIFIEGSGYQAVAERGLDCEHPISFYANGIEVEDLKFLPIDMCDFLPYFCTVVQSAIAVAAYMGFTQIYLLGCDCTGILNFIDRMKGREVTNYAFTIPAEEEIRQPRFHTTCEHMFFEWHHIFKSYRILDEVLKKKDVKLINLTEDGILDSLEKGNLTDVLQAK